MPDAESRQQITALLLRIHEGDADAQAMIANLIYSELRGIAANLMQSERVNHTLEPTALVNEAFVRLIEQDVLRLAKSRRYLFGAMTRAMRHILVDHARARNAEKRGGGRQAEAIDRVLASYEDRNIDYLVLDEALTNLAKMNERQYEVITLRHFCGCSIPEIARQLEMSQRTIENDYRAARAYLRLFLDDHDVSHA